MGMGMGISGMWIEREGLYQVASAFEVLSPVSCHGLAAKSNRFPTCVPSVLESRIWIEPGGLAWLGLMGRMW